MSKADEFQKQYEIGLPIFKELFNLNKVELKEKLKSICGDKCDSDVIEHGGVTKIIEDDEPSSIKLGYYGSCLSISPFGIYFQPEHRDNKKIVEFNEHFVL